MRFWDNSLKIVAHNTMLQEWAKCVIEFRSSGLSVKEWCKENNIALSTSYTWQKRGLEERCPPLETAKLYGKGIYKCNALLKEFDVTLLGTQQRL